MAYTGVQSADISATNPNAALQTQGLNAPSTTQPSPVSSPINTSQPTPTSTNTTQNTTPGATPVNLQSIQQGIQQAQKTATDLSAQIAQKYQAGLKTAQTSGQPVPTSQGDASTAVTGITGGNTQPPTLSPIETQMQNDPGFQQLLKDQQTYMSVTNQQQSMQQTYDQISQKVAGEYGQAGGLASVNTQLVDWQNVINGSEKEISQEISSAGGTATHAQVMAMSAARNQVLTQNYNALLQTRNDMINQINTEMGYAKEDQANALSVANEKLNFDKQVSEYYQKFQTNAQEAYNKIISTPGYGYKALYASTGGNPATVNQVEQTLGLPTGYLKNLAAQPDVTAEKDALSNQLLQAQISSAQASARKTNLEASALAPVSPNDPTVLASMNPNSQSILAQTGLSVAAFNYLTQGTTALSRLSSADRQKIMNESGAFLNKNGLDYSTFQSQYKAQNTVVQQNIERAANTKIFGGEVSGTVAQFIQDVGNNIPNLKSAAVADLFVKGQTNDQTVQKYAFDLQTMQNDLAGYYAASRGSTSPDQADLNAAANVIQQGLSTKGATAFKSSIDSNVQKVSGVVNEAVTSAQQAVWSQFGVGEKYKPASSQGSSQSLPANVQSDLLTGLTFKGTTAYLPSTLWAKYKTMGIQDQILQEAKGDGYTLLIQ